MVPFMPRLIRAILPNLSHHAPMIQSSARRTNRLLFGVIHSLPLQSEFPSRQNNPSDRLPPSIPRPRPSSPVAQGPIRQPTLPFTRDFIGDTPPDTTVSSTSTIPIPPKRNSLTSDGTTRPAPTTSVDTSSASYPRPQSPASTGSVHHPSRREGDSLNEQPLEAFDYQETLDALTLQFLSEHEETRVAALRWLIMLHQKTPKVDTLFFQSQSCLLMWTVRFLLWMIARSPPC